MTSNLLPIIVTAAWIVFASATIFCVPALREAARKLRRRPAFLAAIGVLAVAALSLNTAVGALRLHFKKLAVPLSVKSLVDPVEGIPSRLGPWVQVSHDEGIDSEMEQVLATRQYLYRDYVDTREWPELNVDGLIDKPAGEREVEIARMQSEKPNSVLRIGITYYTGMADTVAHIPERCYVADGFEPSAYEVKTANFGTRADGMPRNVSYRFITFEDQTGRGRVARNVAYLFHVDGAYESDSLAVRRRLQSLFERYGYYAKLELMTSRPAAKSASRESAPASSGETTAASTVATMNDFLSVMLPELERCLPNWNSLHESSETQAHASASP